MNKKYKILMFVDHPLSFSGVATQANWLIRGLLKTNKYSFKIFGAAIKHSNYDIVKVNEDYIIKPIDGFGNPEILRLAIATERPDAIFLFTDPRFFIWMIQMEDEIHNAGIPIVWWTIWDNLPVPRFNLNLYKSVDLLNCISDLTYEMISEMVPERTNFVPHSLPTDIFKPINPNQALKFKKQLLGSNRQDHFVGLWINRNARRKRPADLLWAWKLFMDRLKKEHRHQKATLICHTDPVDVEGINFFPVMEKFGIMDSVFISKDKRPFEEINVLHNISDFYINISHSEGFGLGSLEALQTGNPVIIPKTGGQTRQVLNPYTGEENGVAMNIDLKTLVGSPEIHYIYEDYVSVENIANSIMKLYNMGEEKRKEIGEKAREYALSEFGYEKMVRKWDETLEDTIKNWRKRYNPWEMVEL